MKPARSTSLHFIDGNFMCHLDWIVACADIWLHVISGLAVCHQMKLAFISMDLVRHLPSLWSGYHPIHEEPEKNKEVEEGNLALPAYSKQTVAKLPEIQTEEDI